MKSSLLIGLVVLLLVVVGCCRKGVPATTTIVTDSTHVEEKTRLVEVIIPGDTVEVLKWIECDSNTNKPKPFKIKKKSNKLTANVELNNHGQLNVTCAEDSLRAVIEAKDREITRIRTEKTKKFIPVHIPYWYDIAARWVAGVFILLIILFIIVKNLKP